MSLTPVFLAEDTIDEEELKSLGAWVSSGERLTKGPLTLKLESEFADYMGTRHSIFLNSGSSANLLMSYALLEGGFLKNKSVIAPSVSWVTTVAPFMQLGFDVSLCECNQNSLGFDLNHFEDLCKKKKPSLAILVHVLGHSNEMKELLEICEKHNVTLLEDSCEALGSLWNGKKLGSLGKAGSFSFYYGHHISTIEGGMVVTDDTELYNLMVSIRSHGWSRDTPDSFHEKLKSKYNIDEVRDLYTFYYPGFNLRSTDLNAFIGLTQIKKLDNISKKREENFNLYKKLLGENFWCQKSDADLVSSFAYGILVENRLDVYRELKDKGIESRPLICGNIGRHPFWIEKHGVSSFKNADVVHEKGLYLPNNFKLTKEQIEYICSIIKDVAVPFNFAK